MGLTSLQVCMDSADWLQGTIHEENGMDCSSPSGDMLTCSRPLIERRLRPQQDQALKCPRCDSTHTKFCYYNNYSLSQPRYFCKTCRRYWTKGGTLRNIPVGGGCRKNKKVSKKSSNAGNDNHHHHTIINPSSSSSNPTDLQLSFPEQIHLNNILANPSFLNMGLLEQNSNRLPIDFMDSKFEAIVGRNNYDFMGNVEMGLVNGIGGDHQNNNYHGLCSPYGMSGGGGGIDGNSNNNGNFMDTCQRMMIPYDHHQGSSEDVKPNTKHLSLEWQDSDNGKDTFGYLNNLGSSWTGMINGYGSSTTTNPLV